MLPCLWPAWQGSSSLFTSKEASPPDLSPTPSPDRDLFRFSMIARDCLLYRPSSATSFLVPAAPREAPIYKMLRRSRRGAPLRKVGIFAGLHGDAEAGIVASQRLSELLARPTDQLRHLELHIYPKCNPSGWLLDTQLTRDGYDLNREFWIGSEAPEVCYLEHELRSENFDAIISLETDTSAQGIYGRFAGDSSGRDLLDHSLKAAESIIPRDLSPIICGKLARQGMIHGVNSGAFSPPPEQTNTLQFVVAVSASADLASQVNASLTAAWTLVAQLERSQSFLTCKYASAAALGTPGAAQFMV